MSGVTTSRDLDGFARRFREREPLIGTFIKTPSPLVVEVLSGTGLDFLVIDEEHAPFDRHAIDLAVLAGRAADIPILVRTADASALRMLTALDCGAAGVIVPHISSVAAAEDIVLACRYRGKRGFSASSRAGGYGRTGVWDHVDGSDAATLVIAMIEDLAAVDAVDAILEVDGLDGLFVGRADLMVSIDDRALDAERTKLLTQRVSRAAAAAGKAACLFLGQAADAADASTFDVSVLVLSSDQGLLRAAASTEVAAARKIMAQG